MKLDENLSEISLITKDAFEPTLPLSVVMHIDYKKAPMIIQRFGDVKKLVEQTLDPMVSAFFKNIAQKMTLIELLQNRAAIQEESAQRDEDEVRGLFARVAGGADRHAARPGRRPDDREHPDPAALAPGRARAGRRPTRSRRRPPCRSAR